METYKGLSVAERPLEIVERKGVGHPDHICDAVAEAISLALCRAYLREWGVVLHHNIDKSLLAAGRVEKWFGGGRVIRPMELSIGDRATFFAGGKTLPVGEIAVAAAKEWLRHNLPGVDPDRHMDFRVLLAPGSDELSDIFARPGRVRGANDTSAAVGYWPLSPTEEAVLGLERFLNSPEFKARFPETGEDVKVMGLRRNLDLDLTVAMPLLAGQIDSERDYFARKALIHEEMLGMLGDLAGFDRLTVHLNMLDMPGRGLGGVYLSLLGTSAEDADSGQVGRGNRVNGLIAVGRPLGTEAVAGKNPVSHVGKIYNFLAHRLARKIHGAMEGIREVYVLMLSSIGAPVDQPAVIHVQLLLARGRKIGEVKRMIEAVCAEELAGMDKFCLELGQGRYPVC